jgi:serine/threonine-protein kinase
VKPASADPPRGSFPLGSASRTGEAARAFFQGRLASLCKWGCLLSCGVYLLACVLVASHPIHTWEAWMSSPSGWLNIAFLASSGAVWALLGNGRVKLSIVALGLVDVGITVLLATLNALLVLFSPETPGRWILILLGFTNLVFFRAGIVPTAPARSAWISLLAAIPGAVIAFTLVKDHATAEDPGFLPLMIGTFVIWMLLSISIAVVTSHIVYGLQKQVREAAQLGQYTLLHKIGDGGMGTVYKAKHALLRRPTAIKLLASQKADKSDLVRFEREVQLTSQLTHPNTIAVYDYGHTEDGVFYYAMEYLEGMTLEALVEEDGPQPPGRVIHILAQVCGALAEAHTKGLIHRDIKPANIILCARGGAHDVVKVLDFGLVKDIRPGDDSRVTQANTISGTPFYLSPEAIRTPESIDARADLYAVGAVGYFLLTGKVVFEGDSFIEICGHHLHSAPVAPSQRLGKALPDDVESMILRCLEKSASARPRDATALHDALAQCRDATEWGERDARAWWAAHGGGAISLPRSLRSPA